MGLINEASLTEFFQQKVCTAIQDSPIKVSSDTEFYLVNLLTTFSQMEKLLEHNKNGQTIERPLAIQLLDSSSADSHHRITILKKLGDMALFISGFFADSLNRKIIDIDYYIKMGHIAYSSLSNLNTHYSPKTLGEVFEELSNKFVHFVNIISSIADSTPIQSNSDILRIYERWLKTGSERNRELLSKEGIIPNELIKTNFIQ